jgi:hypothetical protein
LCMIKKKRGLYETSQSGQRGLLKMSCMDPIHCTRGIYFDNCYWCAMDGHQ